MSPDTSQVLFRSEYEHELEAWVRRRFAYLCITYVSLGAINLAVSLLALASLAGSGVARTFIYGALASCSEAVAALLIVIIFFLRRHGYATRADVIGAATWMILALGAVSLSFRFVAAALGTRHPGSMVFAIFFWHLTACLFLPWTPRDSLRPILPLLAAWGIYTVVFDTGPSLVGRILAVVFSPGLLIPGLLISGLRLRLHSRRFRSTMLGRHFRALRQEFSRAREIHESLFPAEYDDGCVRFQYTYEPMRELGGDFLHLRVGARGFANLTLLDVTGHGLAAALTVNRIHGELERIQAESPQIGPGELVELLNRYMVLTMVKHNIYATAISLSLDPYVGELRWASAGHPPGFLRGVNGVVRELGSTALLLGAVGDGDFEGGEQRMELSPGDIVVVYTDGTFEARDPRGRQLGLDRLRETMRCKPPPGNWPQFLRAMVDKHKAGRTEDDVLVASLTFNGFRQETRRAAEAAAHR